MKKFFSRIKKEDRGVLTFEWILLITLLTIGVVGGLSAVRDAMLDELGDVAQAMVSLDQSYTIVNPVEVSVHDRAIDGASNSLFIDEMTYGQCRPQQPAVTKQGPEPAFNQGGQTP